MENNLLDALKKQTNFIETENGAIARSTTFNAVYDMFALAGSYRTRTDEDCIFLFKKALENHETLTMKCLFYLRDIRGGQGERRFFRVCFNWLAKNHPEIARRNIANVAEYGRWDDLYCLVGTPLENEMFAFIRTQLNTDLNSFSAGENQGVSLLAKWLKSENASSIETKELATKTRKYLGLSHKAYRKTLSILRSRINIVEKLMSENRWNEIEFDKIPSKAGLIYRNAFAHKEIIAEKYADFIANKQTKVNASALFPYEIVDKVSKKIQWNGSLEITETERQTLEKYWDNQKDYLDGKKCKMMCVVDTSGSMDSTYGGSVRPIDVAISLGMYCAERIGEPFHNHFISFSSRPQLIEIEGIDFADKVRRIYNQNLCQNTDLKATFDLLKNMVLYHDVPKEDLPETLIVISDMEIDHMSYWRNKTQAETEMETLRKEWAEEGLKLPHLVYWNVAARNNVILDGSRNTTYVSGCNPVIFESILAGKKGIDLMLDKLKSERYEQVM
jgi:hypothetical protein